MNATKVFTHLLSIILVFAVCSFSQIGNGVTGYQPGRYEGQAFNSTAKARGSVVFDLYDLDPSSGKVRAYSGFSNGLEGEAWLTGKISRTGELDLSGTLASFRMRLRGHLEPDGSIKADYMLEGSNPQEGNFEVTFRQKFPPEVGDASGAAENIIGAWEVGGGLPAQVNPVTGQPTGVSFVDAHRLEFFPGGQFKHLWSHRHCEAGIRCCSEQAKLEEGTYSLMGRQLSFDITGGTLISSDSCNPRVIGHTTVAKHKETFTLTIQPGMGTTQLCLRNSESEGPACYQKQS